MDIKGKSNRLVFCLPLLIMAGLGMAYEPDDAHAYAVSAGAIWDVPVLALPILQDFKEDPPQMPGETHAVGLDPGMSHARIYETAKSLRMGPHG